MSFFSDIIKAYSEGEATKAWGPGWREKLEQLRATTRNLGLEGERTAALTAKTGLESQQLTDQISAAKLKNAELAKRGIISPEAEKEMNEIAIQRATQAHLQAQTSNVDANRLQTSAETERMPTVDEARLQREAELRRTRAETTRALRPPTEPGSFTWITGPNGQPMLYNPKSDRVASGPGEAGDPYSQAPTADMRNRQAARKFVGKAIGQVKSLSDQLITKKGLAQRAQAAGQSIESFLGNDPVYRTYQDARMALAGNLAVAQQGSRPSDTDVMKIWLPLVPDVFRDSNESAALKWQMISANTHLEDGGPSPIPSGPGPTPGTAPPTGSEDPNDPLGLR